MRVLLVLVLACSPSIAAGPRPVSVGGNEDIDACASLSQVGGAKSGMISVRAGPGADYAEIDRLDNGQFVYDCDTSGEWSGVVYLRGKEMAPDCGVGSPIARRAPYQGRCKSGWVRTKWLTVVAG